MFFVIAALISMTVLKRAHPASRAVLFTLVLLRFVVPFSPSFGIPITASLVGRAAVTLGTPLVEAVPASSAFDLLFVAWAAGVVAIGARRFAKYLRVKRRLSTYQPAPWTLIERLQLRTVIAPPGEGPCLVGVINPTLVLPADAGGAVLEAMIVHELMHLRRRDPFVRLFQSIVETLFFFWPPVRLTSRWLCLAREQACDLAVIESKVITPSGYAELLLHLGLTPEAGLSMAATPSHLERRITMLLTEKKLRPLWGVVAVALLVAVFTGTTVGAATTPETLVPQAPQGSIDPALIKAVMQAHLDEVQGCYAELLQRDPTAKGELKLHLEISPEGRVKDVCQSEGTTIDMQVGRCISERMAWWAFPKPIGGSVSVTYPFTFDPNDGC